MEQQGGWWCSSWYSKGARVGNGKGNWVALPKLSLHRALSLPRPRDISCQELLKNDIVSRQCSWPLTEKRARSPIFNLAFTSPAAATATLPGHYVHRAGAAFDKEPHRRQDLHVRLCRGSSLSGSRTQRVPTV